MKDIRETDINDTEAVNELFVKFARNVKKSKTVCDLYQRKDEATALLKLIQE